MQTFQNLFLGILISIPTLSFGSTVKAPYLGIANNTSDLTANVTYKTQDEPNGIYHVPPKTAVGFPILPDGEPVTLGTISFSQNGNVKNIQDWCPNISRDKVYNTIYIEVDETADQLNVICSGN